jgi:hypothetical protein
MFHPVASNLTMAEAKRSRINAFGIQYDGKTGCRRRTSRGPPDLMAAEQATSVAGSGLRPAFAARGCAWAGARALRPRRLGWWWTVGQMQGMDEGPWTALGTFGWFLGVWVVMMAAMMFPSVAPTVALYARMTRSGSPLRRPLFTAGYLLTWTAAGVAAWTIALGISRLAGGVLAWDQRGRGSPGPPSSSRPSMS